MFQLFFEEVARILQECFKGIEKKVSKVFHGSFKVISEKLQQCAKSVSKAHPGSFQEFLKVLSWCFRDAWHFLCVSRVIDARQELFQADLQHFFKPIHPLYCMYHIIECNFQQICSTNLLFCETKYPWYLTYCIIESGAILHQD